MAKKLSVEKNCETLALLKSSRYTDVLGDSARIAAIRSGGVAVEFI